MFVRVCFVFKRTGIKENKLKLFIAVGWNEGLEHTFNLCTKEAEVGGHCEFHSSKAAWATYSRQLRGKLREARWREVEGRPLQCLFLADCHFEKE